MDPPQQGDPPPPPLEISATPVEKIEERAREHIAWWLLGIFAGTIAVVLGLLGAGLITGSDTKDVFSILIPPEVSLLGAVMGFYYGSRKQQ